MVYTEQKYKVRPIRVSKRFDYLNQGKAVELNPNLYDRLSLYQGSHYRTQLIALGREPKFKNLLLQAEKGESPTAVKAVKDIISKLQGEAVSVGEMLLIENHPQEIKKLYDDLNTTYWLQVAKQHSADMSSMTAVLTTFADETAWGKK